MLQTQAISTGSPGAAKTGRVPPPPQTASAWRLNVMLVEDDLADTVLILDVLRRNADVGAAHWHAEPARALVEIAEGRFAPDLVLVDIHMPVLDGFGFVDALRQTPAGAATPVIFLTTSSLARDVEAARRRQASAYVVKPESYQELQTRLDAAIRQAKHEPRRH